MYDTRPDLDSYLFAARRLWWVPLVVAVLGLATVRSPGPGQQVTQAFLRVPDPVGFWLASGVGQPYAPRAEMESLAAYLPANVDLSSGDVVNATVDAGMATAIVDLESADEASARAALDELNEAIAVRWADQIGASMGPARALVTSKVESATAELAANSSGELPLSELEVARLTEMQFENQALVESIRSIEATPPVATLVSTEMESSGSGLLTLVAPRLVGGLFLGIGVVMVLCLFDHRVRRRSLIERNGLSVAAVRDPTGDEFAALPAVLLASTDVEQPDVVVVAVGGEGLAASVADVLLTDPALTSAVALDPPPDTTELVAAVRVADLVVLAVSTGTSSYRDLLEVARTVQLAGAGGVCVALDATSKRALVEARS